MSNKKQNSVEWLAQAIYDKMKMRGDGKVFQGILEQAKAMHKDEIENAQIIAISNADMTNNRGYFDTEQYYNETFGGQYNHIVDTTEMICEDVNCKHCAEDIAQMQDDDLTDDEWLIKEKHKHILNFAVWFKESDWDCYDNTDRGNLYANPLVTDSLLTIEEIYELFLKKEL